MPARGVAFVYGTHGKPELSPTCNPNRLRFNVSHSQDLGVIALAVDRAVGIDLECVKPLANYEAIARHHFTEAESVALSIVAPSERLQAFFVRGFTRSRRARRVAELRTTRRARALVALQLRPRARFRWGRCRRRQRVDVRSWWWEPAPPSPHVRA